jgi:STE24 endopeptidase
LVARGGLAIPPSRMFEMKASEKLNSLNAYVSGFGGSKRVVVWDTTLQKLTTPETLFVFGHEMGHYVLGHIRNSLLWLSVLLLVLLFLGRTSSRGSSRAGDWRPTSGGLGFAAR